jgi:maltokinase
VNLPLADWLPAQRWYAGRGRELVSADPVAVTTLRDGLDVMLVDAAYRDGAVERYQVIVAWDVDPIAEYAEQVTIGRDDGRIGYDALYDPSSAAYLLELLNDSAICGDIVFSPEPDTILPADAPPRVSGVEQSNTSVIFGEQAILKLFRRITAGVNPDIELPRAGPCGKPECGPTAGFLRDHLGRPTVPVGNGDRLRPEFRAGLGHGHRQRTGSLRRR